MPGNAFRCASLDGDADRIVFFFPTDTGFFLLDGDRIAVLVALLINRLVSELQGQSKVSVISIHCNSC